MHTLHTLDNPSKLSSDSIYAERAFAETLYSAIAFRIISTISVIVGIVRSHPIATLSGGSLILLFIIFCKVTH